MSEELNKVVENAEETVEEVKAEAEEAVEAVQDKAEEVVEAAEDKAEEAADAAKGLKDKVQELLDKTDVDEKIVEGAKGLFGKITGLFKGDK